MVDTIKDHGTVEPEDTQGKPSEPEPVEPDEPKQGNADDGDGDREALDAHTQAIIERRIQREVRKQQARYDAEIKTKQEQLEKEAREARLLEDKNYQELAEQRARELERLQSEIGKRELNDKTDRLLDKAEITQPEIRALIKELPGDLESRQQQIDGIMAVIDAQVEKRVADRLRMPAPKKDGGQGGSKPLKEMTPEERNEARKKMGDKQFAEAWRKANTVP